jgi:IS5 family transposase
MSTIRAKVEHVFRVMKCQFGYRKVQYNGIAKNAAQVFSLICLADLYSDSSKFQDALSGFCKTPIENL